MATIDVLTPLRLGIVNTPSNYVGVYLSLVDLLGPFAEIALRDPDASFSPDGAEFLNLIAPRASVLLGYPSLSKKLAVGISGSLRTVIPVRRNEVTDQAAYNYESWLWADDHSRQFMRSIEFGLFVSYVP